MANLVGLAVILGIIQGLTEFFPISSSGHLVILQSFFPQIQTQAVAFDLILHLGTASALIIYFFKDFKQIFTSKKLIFNLVLATALTVILVLPFNNLIESSFRSPKFAGLMLIVTGLILYLASRKTNNTDEEINYKKSALIGVGQALAVLPGLSRSGVTISFGIFSGLKPKEAIKFSFLLAIPTILGASLLEIKELENLSRVLTLPSLFGFFTSLICGLIAIKWLVKILILNQKNLIYFAIYCFTLGILTIILI